MTTIRPQNILASYNNPLTIVPHTLAEAEVTTPSAQKLTRDLSRTPVEPNVPAAGPAKRPSEEKDISAELDVYA